MSGKRLRKMVTGIVEARQWADRLVKAEWRGPGDMEGAMRRLENRYGIPWRIFHDLKYRPPSDVLVGVYVALKTAYEAECERQEAKFRHERSLTEAKGTFAAHLVGAADFVAREEIEQ